MRSTFWALSLALVGLGMALTLPAAALPKAGSAAPSFTGTTLAGKKLSLAQYRGKVVLVNFFSRH